MIAMTMEGEKMSSSRLIVKNLPKSATEEKLRELFSQKGEITDVKLKYGEDGKFRHFAFIGYRSAEEATAAQDYFDRTFIGAARMTVEICSSLGEKPKPVSKLGREKLRAESKREAESHRDTEAKPAKRKKKEDEILEKCDEDPAFMEFLQAHKKSAAAWGNDSVADELLKLKQRKEQEEQEETRRQAKVAAGKEKEAAKKKKHKVEFHTLKLRDVPKKAKKKDIKAFFAPLKVKSIRFPPGVRGIVFAGFQSDADVQKALQKNKSILLGNQIRLRNFGKDDDGQTKDEKRTKWKQLEEELEKEAEPIRESGRLFIRNLPYTTNEDEVTKIFKEFGPITELHLPIDKITRKLKGIGFVSFMLPEHAENAFHSVDGTIFQGRTLHLLPAKSQDDHAADELNAGSSYKTQKEQKLKKSASSSHNWNALFLGSTAISKVISEKYGISREEMLLDKSDEQDSRLASVGVRMALAETEIVSETKKFLEDNGVCLDAFDSSDKKAERSKTTLLAKNLPVGTSIEDLKDLFHKHGVLNRIVLPPWGVTGIIEFDEPAEARVAFKKLAYSKFFDLPLYLEWAPIGVFSSPADASKRVAKMEVDLSLKTEAPELSHTDTSVPASVKVDQSTTSILDKIEGLETIDENAVPELDTTLFVKNLNFRTQEAGLKKHFLECGPIYTVTVARRKDPTNSDNLLSMGYGFVQFYRTKDAEKALSTLHDTMLENHLLEIKRSNRTLMKDGAGAGAGDESKKKSNGSKILVRNVPFLATQEEITDLFKTFGNLKAVRLPRKLTGSGEHRGFAFIEYYSDSDAKKAFDTLCKSTHLYGRRLVLEWASQDESIEDLRAKTARLASAAKSSEDDGGAGLGGGSTKRRLQRYFQTNPTSKANDEEEENDDN